MNRRGMLVVAAAMVLGSVEAYQPIPGMKTVWGEKVTPENAWREYPRPQMVRADWTNLNGLWQYAVTTNAPGVPGKWDGEILVPFVIESQLSGVGRVLEPQETLWYRRSFDANVRKGERLLLHFEQVDFRTMVFVNGVEAGVPHEGGQVPFSFDITDLVRPGANDLVVSVWDPTSEFVGSHGKQNLKPKGTFYTRSSGIGGTVWLEAVPERHIRGYEVVTDIDAGDVVLKVKVEGEGEQRMEIAVFDPDGKKVAEATPLFTFTSRLHLGKKAVLWSPEKPSLYSFTARCGKDEIRGYFGMRKIELRKDPNGVPRFYFNNAPRFIIGTLDQGWWPDGLLTPPSDEAMAFDITVLKKMGYDTLRKHIKVEPRRYYHLCDKLGILVIQDMPSGFSDRQKRYGFYRRELQEVMDHLQATPSIVMWVPYNEGWGQPGQFLTHATLAWTRRYDPTRLVDGPSGWNDWEGGELLKPHVTTKHLPSGQDEQGHAVDRHDYGSFPQMPSVNGYRASFLGEFGGLGCRVAGHLWTENAWGYGDTGKDTDRDATQGKFVAMMEHVAGLAARGLAGSVYTQTTDVEGEINGLITYDRKVVKFDPAALAAVHRKVREGAADGLERWTVKRVLPRLDPSPTAWAWTAKSPAAEWTQPGFDDSAWKRSAGGFGGSGIEYVNSDARIATRWTTKSLWLRRHFELDADSVKRIRRVTFDMFHDEGVEIYLNGKRILETRAQDYTTDWKPFFVAAEKFAAAAKAGDNVLSVKVVQISGGQYFDCGLSVDLPEGE